MSQLSCHLYISIPSKKYTDKEISNFLIEGRSRNQQREITGVLLASKEYFLQYFEGPIDNVTHLFSRIEVDPKHSAVLTLHASIIDKRLFPTWYMGFEESDLWGRSLLHYLKSIENQYSSPAIPTLQSFLKKFY